MNVYGLATQQAHEIVWTLFQRCNNVVNVQTTLQQRQNDTVCLLGKMTVA